MTTIFGTTNEPVDIIPTPNQENSLLMLRDLISANRTELLAVGQTKQRTDIPSLRLDRDTQEYSQDTFLTLPEYKVDYPEVVIEVVMELLREYDEIFGRELVEANREWDTDYQFCYVDDGHGNPMFQNPFKQVDMAGLPSAFLAIVDNLPREQVKAIIRERIFEFENSLARYNLMRGMFDEGDFMSLDGQPSLFKENFDYELEAIRQRASEQLGRPMKVAVLAITKEKYEAMKTTEYGKLPDEDLRDDEVRAMAGFDKLFGPDEFMEYINSVGEDNSEYILYVRSSYPDSDLKKPDKERGLPVAEILKDDFYRRVIKKYAITPNIDHPESTIFEARDINDTKRYMPFLRMGVALNTADDFNNLPNNEELLAYLASRGLALENNPVLRIKPLGRYYGAIGHASGFYLGSEGKDFRNETRKIINKMGPVIMQTEIPASVVIDAETDATYKYIDRIFFSGRRFIGGFRNMIPITSFEAHKNNIHGNSQARYAEIRKR